LRQIFYCYTGRRLADIHAIRRPDYRRLTQREPGTRYGAPDLTASGTIAVYWHGDLCVPDLYYAASTGEAASLSALEPLAQLVGLHDRRILAWLSSHFLAYWVRTQRFDGVDGITAYGAR
jgi:hypothetical protein